MKQIIKNALDDMATGQINLDSDATRETVSNLISDALKNKGAYKQYTKTELKKRNEKESWVCQTCGKSTYETEYDYLVHPKLHLGCALEEELKGKTIHEQYHEASSKAHEDDVAKALGHMDDDGNYITKDIPEEKEEWDGRPIYQKQIDQKYAEYQRKLSEEIVDNKDVKYIYESPDGGKTIYRREFQKTEREVVKDFQKKMNERKSMVENQGN